MSGPTETDARAQDEQEIRAIVDRMFDAWGRGDAAAYREGLAQWHPGVGHGASID